MPTLNIYRKQAGFTSIKAFAEAANLTPSIASQWLNGDRQEINETLLLVLLHINREQYLDAYEESRDEAETKWRKKHPITPEILAAHEASIRQTVDKIYPKMTPWQRARMHEHAVEMGIAAPDRRSPLDRMIDQACGIDA